VRLKIPVPLEGFGSRLDETIRMARRQLWFGWVNLDGGCLGCRQNPFRNFSARGSHGPVLGVWKGSQEANGQGVAMIQQSPSDAALVLIVDDDHEVRQVTADLLETLGYRVLTARTEPEAVEQLHRNSQISVLLTDIRMPRIGGEELAGIAVTWRPDIGVVFMSGFGRPRGNSEFLRKPYRATDLIRVFPPQPLPSSIS